MRKKRNRLDIIYDILATIRDRGERVKPTHILYKSNLSYHMLTTYMKELKEGGFLREEEDKQGKRFVLSEKAYGYLQDYDKIKGFLDSYGLD